LNRTIVGRHQRNRSPTMVGWRDKAGLHSRSFKPVWLSLAGLLCGFTLLHVRCVPDRLLIREVPSYGAHSHLFLEDEPQPSPRLLRGFLIGKRIAGLPEPQLLLAVFLAGCRSGFGLFVLATFSLPGPAEPCGPYEPLLPLRQHKTQLFNDVLDLFDPCPRVR